MKTINQCNRQWLWCANLDNGQKRFAKEVAFELRTNKDDSVASS